MGTEPQDMGLALQPSLCAVEGIAVLLHRPSQGSGCSAQGQAPTEEDVAPLSGPVNYLGLRHMNHGLTLSAREFGEVGLGMYT